LKEEAMASTTTDAQADVILPPPSASNPLPAVVAALRVHHREILTQLLEKDPSQSSSQTSALGDSASSYFTQWLVFSDESLRTLLLRHVLQDPDRLQQSFAGKKKNWSARHAFSFPPHWHILGTHVFNLSSSASEEEDTSSSKSSTVETNWNLLLESLTASLDTVVLTYFVRASDLEETQALLERLQAWPKRVRAHHRIVYLPAVTTLHQEIFKARGLASQPNISIQSLALDLIPLETDVWSTEYGGLRQATVEGTPSPLVTATARSLLKLSDLVGPLPRIQAFGNLATDVLTKYLTLTVDEAAAANTGTEAATGLSTLSSVAAMVVLDRQVDWVTPMLTPLTYEGLLDDNVGIDTGFLTVPVETINPSEDAATAGDKKEEDESASSSERVVLSVHGSDKLYAQVRNQHVEVFGSFLQNQAMALKESHTEFTAHGKRKDLTEIHQFVKQIPIFTQNLRSLTNHIHLAECIKKNTEDAIFRERWQTERSMVEGEICYELLEDMVASQYPVWRFLPLLCLQSLCAGGIKSSRFDALRRDIVQTYGYEYLFLLHHLEKAGLLRRREGLFLDSAAGFASLRQSLVLIHPEVQTAEPDDVAYVSSGYAPLSARLIQTAVQHGWHKLTEALRELPGRKVDVRPAMPPVELATLLQEQQKTRSPQGSLASMVQNEGNALSSTHKPILLVCYIGGVTYMEIAALRFLSNRRTFPFHIVIVTTKILNARQLVQSLM
jgi:hypothetical protein